MDRIVYVIINRVTGAQEGVYSRAYHDEYEFGSKDAALRANCHGIYEDETKYRIAKYRVSYE